MLSRFASVHLNGAALKPPIAAFGCSEDGPSFRAPPPELGQHTDEVLKELGYSPVDVDRLRKQAVV